MRPSYLHRLTLRQVEIYLAVCRLRSYSRAAEELRLTQPAVSSQIRQLEQLVGEPLLNYVAKRLFLTPAGELVESAARDLQQRLIATEMELAELHGRVQGALTIAAESSAQYFLPDVFAEFCQQHPGVELQFEVVNHATALRRVPENRDDFVVMGIIPQDRSLTFVPFRENQLVAIAHPGSDIAKLALPTIDDLTNETLLVREPGSGTRAIFAQYCLEQGVRFDRMQQLGSIEAVKAGVLAGLGTAVLPADACQNELALGKLKTLSIRGFPLRRSWCALYPKGKQLTPVAERFLNHLLGSG